MERARSFYRRSVQSAVGIGLGGRLRLYWSFGKLARWCFSLPRWPPPADRPGMRAVGIALAEGRVRRHEI